MPAPPRALVNPQADFWLLGGLSILIPVGLGLLFPHWVNAQASLQLVGWAFFAPLILNAPHFAFSYLVFYRGLRRRLFGPDLTPASKIRMVFAGFIVPVIMTGYFVVAMAAHSMKMMGHSVNAMLLLSVWHYARQGYGALIAGSAYRGIFYGPRQKIILNANAYMMPLLAWIMFNSNRRISLFYDVSYTGLNFPGWLAAYLMVPVIVFGLLSIGVFLRIWLIDKKGIPVNGVTGYVCATYLWLLLLKISPNFYFLVPIFHAIQYFPFIYKFKKIETAREERITPDELWENARGFSSMVVFAMTGIVLGAVFMIFLPRLMDLLVVHYSPPPAGFSRNFFLVSFLLFINIHHFFIDYAFWRRDNKDVQQFLFRA